MTMIHGYSERGLVNALFETLVGAQDAQRLLRTLLSKTTFLHWDKPASRFEVNPDIVGFEVFIEPSLSDFGSPDVLLLVKYSDGPEDAFFIEAKRETFESSAPGIKDSKRLSSNASTILHELFLKARFHLLARSVPGKLQEGVFVYHGDGTGKRPKKRKIGKDQMVLDLARRLSELPTAYFVALTTDRTPQPGHVCPDIVNISNLMFRIDELNKDADPGLDPDPYGDPRGGWVECSLLLTWQDVYNWAQSEQLDRMTRTLDENISKLKLPPPDHPFQSIDAFFTTRGLPRGRARQAGRTTLYSGTKAVLTYAVDDGLGGDPSIHIYFVGDQTNQTVRWSRLQGLNQKGDDLVQAIKQL